MIKTIGVVGAGTMGNGIAQVAAMSGKSVVLHDIEEGFLKRAMGGIEKSLRKLAEKGKLTGSPEEVLGRIKTTTALGDLAPCDYVVEAVVECLETKCKVFRELDGICRPGVILSTNTSSISVTKIASVTKRPDRVIGCHFMNPVPLMALVEVVRGLATSQATVDETTQLAKDLGKTPCEVNDYPGFISNRVLMPMINEAVFALEEGVATRENIDSVMKLGMNHPMGPLALADLIGLDVCLAILNVLHDGFKDPKYRPCHLLVKKVEAGQLGRKTGAGFYEYPKT